jgi:hypothetical protein
LLVFVVLQTVSPRSYSYKMSDILWLLFCQDQEKLGSFVSRNYNTKLQTVDLSVKGWNWGTPKFEGNLNNVCKKW